MYVDNLLTLSGAVSADGVVTGQTVTGTNTSVISTNVVDLGTARDIGEGEDLYLRTQVKTAFSGGTSVEIQCVTADDSAISANVNVLASTGAIPVAELTAGKRFAGVLRPRLQSNGQRYIAARYVLVGAVATGAAFSDIGLEVQDGQKYHTSGFSVI